MLKTVVCVETMFNFVQDYLMNRKFKRTSLIEILSNIKVFAVTFDQFNMPLQNKSINSFKERNYWPQTFEQ